MDSCTNLCDHLLEYKQFYIDKLKLGDGLCDTEIELNDDCCAGDVELEIGTLPNEKVCSFVQLLNDGKNYFFRYLFHLFSLIRNREFG